MCMWKHWGFLIVDAISRYWKTPCIEWNKSVTKNGTKNRNYWPKREVCVKHQKRKKLEMKECDTEPYSEWWKERWKILWDGS
jgi:hypothetical protein